MASQRLQFLIVLLAVLISNGYAKSAQKIVGGYEAPISLFSYHVFLKTHFNGYFIYCGGVMIDNRHILTAAHCCYFGGRFIPSESYSIITGTSYPDYAFSEDKFNVSRVIPHPRYNSTGSYDNDIAILTTSTPMPIIYGRRNFADLPTEDVKVGSVVTYTGWKHTKINGSYSLEERLQSVDTSVIDINECKAQYPSWNIQDTQICTRADRGSTPCEGDSGSPLASIRTVVGIVSKGSCDGSGPMISTRVYSYLPWIKEILNSPVD